MSSSSRKPLPGKPRPMSAWPGSNTNGQFLVVMCGTELGALRTGAASAVAIRHLAVPQAYVMAVIGCGVAGAGGTHRRTGCTKVVVRVCVRYRPRCCGAVRRDMETRHGLVVAVTESAEAAVEHADIVRSPPRRQPPSSRIQQSARERMSMPSARILRARVNSVVIFLRERGCFQKVAPLSSVKPVTS